MEEMAVTENSGYEEIYKYDYATGEFGVINSDGVVSTYYKLEPEDWEELIRANGVKEGDVRNGPKLKSSRRKSNKKRKNRQV